MSNEEKQELQMNDEKRAFIREQIVPKRRSACKRFMGSIGKTSFFAILFGMVASVVFCTLNPYFDEIFGKEEKNTVLLVHPTPLPIATTKPEEKEETKETKEREKIKAVVDIDTMKESYQMLKEVAANFNHSVVTVSGVQNGVDWFNNPVEASDATSGIILVNNDKKLYILTNYKKISEVNHIQVTFENKETVEAALHGKDKDINIAIISVDYESLSKDTKETIQTAVLGDSYYAKKGTPVLALGKPDGYMYSMEVGMITGDLMEQYITDSMVELACTNIQGVEDGDGVLVDLDGTLIGIITHQFDEKTKNSNCTAISINRIKTVIERMINETKSPYFGVVASNIPEEYKSDLGVEHGIYVTEVKNHSPALDAGIQVGDIIMQVKDTSISSISNFIGVLSLLKPKEEVSVKILRTTQVENKEKKVTVILGKK